MREIVKTELLAPAGNFEKLKTAIHFGADAVYLGGESFSLRANAGNFSDAQIDEACAYAKARGKKVYVTANIFAKNADFPAVSSCSAALANSEPSFSVLPIRSRKA